MPFPLLPDAVDAIDPRRWETFQPYFDDLVARDLPETAVQSWLQDWSGLLAVVNEAAAVIDIQKSLDTADPEKEAVFLDFINNVVPNVQVANQQLKHRLLALTIPADAVPDLEMVLRVMQNEVDLFREENVPLQTELSKLSNEYDKITGGLVVDWDGEEKNLSQLALYLQDKDRAVRKRAWLAMMSLWQGAREQLDALFSQMLPIRQQMAVNAGLADYREYVFREYGRFDYTPADCLRFHDAIESVVVPAAARIYARKQARLGVTRLRPWDTQVDPSDKPMLRPYTGQEELIQRSLNLVNHVDPMLGRYLATMAEEELLDLDTRAGKALGGYCTTLSMRKRPFIFMNGVGIQEDVQTMLHEAGHAFHVFETANLPFIWQTHAPIEFCEVASMSMELLAYPYLTNDFGGFYSYAEAARARIEHLEAIVTFLPYMAVVDAFQHWVYTHPEDALSPQARDHTWDQLWHRFMKGIDYEGFESIRQSGWQQKLHIFQVPFYYIEYGMAQVGALQIWRNSQADPAGAVAAYRRALALGGTRPLPELFATAGAEFRFDTEMLAELVAHIEETLSTLETQI